jgi:hypothetical protein
MFMVNSLTSLWSFGCVHVLKFSAQLQNACCHVRCHPGIGARPVPSLGPFDVKRIYSVAQGWKYSLSPYGSNQQLKVNGMFAIRVLGLGTACEQRVLLKVMGHSTDVQAPSHAAVLTGTVLNQVIAGAVQGRCALQVLPRYARKQPQVLPHCLLPLLRANEYGQGL